jgi:hypothetical protein
MLAYVPRATRPQSPRIRLHARDPHAAGYRTLGAVAEASVADLQKIFGACGRGARPDSPWRGAVAHPAVVRSTLAPSVKARAGRALLCACDSGCAKGLPADDESSDRELPLELIERSSDNA